MADEQSTGAPAPGAASPVHYFVAVDEVLPDGARVYGVPVAGPFLTAAEARECGVRPEGAYLLSAGRL